MAILEFEPQKSRGEDLKFMLSRFSDYRNQILHEYATNDEFKTLCEDFYASALIVESLKKKLPGDKKNELGYRTLFLKLENEIRHFLRIKTQKFSTNPE